MSRARVGQTHHVLAVQGNETRVSGCQELSPPLDALGKAVPAGAKEFS
jgi:hypothetical protein